VHVTYTELGESLYWKMVKVIVWRYIFLLQIYVVEQMKLLLWHNHSRNIASDIFLELDYGEFWDENDLNVLDPPNLRRCTRPCFSAQKNWIHTMGFPYVQTQWATPPSPLVQHPARCPRALPPGVSFHLTMHYVTH